VIPRRSVRVRRRATIVGCALALFAGGALAQGAGEHLYVNLKCKLPGWTALPTLHSSSLELTAIVPPGQNGQNWTDQVAVETFYGPPQRSAQELMAERVEQIDRECEDTAVGPVSPVVENGYDTAMRAVACTKAKKLGQGEVTLYKAWKGRDAMYLVARSWRGHPFDKAHVPVPPETTLQWLAFVQSIVLCDSRDPQHPCPDPNVPCAAKAP